jgi:hypothetical protein
MAVAQSVELGLSGVTVTLGDRICGGGTVVDNAHFFTPDEFRFGRS